MIIFQDRLGTNIGKLQKEAFSCRRDGLPDLLHPAGAARPPDLDAVAMHSRGKEAVRGRGAGAQNAFYTKSDGQSEGKHSNEKAFCVGVADRDVRGREGALPEMPLGVFRGAEPVRAVLAVRTRE